MRAAIDLELTIDGERAESEMTCTWAGAHVLTVHTVIPLVNDVKCEQVLTRNVSS